MAFRVYHWIILAIAILGTLFAILAILLILWPQLIPSLTASFTGSGTTVATVVLAVATFWLVVGTNLTIKRQISQSEKDKKQALLHEIREWIYEIKNITLSPVKELSLEGINTKNINDLLKYGTVFNKAEYFKLSMLKMLRSEEMVSSTSKIMDLLTPLMLIKLSQSKQEPLDLEDSTGLVGFEKIKEALKNKYQDKIKEAQKQPDIKDPSNHVLQELLTEYSLELNKAESKLVRNDYIPRKVSSVLFHIDAKIKNYRT